MPLSFLPRFASLISAAVSVKPALSGCALACAVLTLGISVPAMAQNEPTPSRVIESVNEARLARLDGNVHPAVRIGKDLGLVDPNLAMDDLHLVLKRSPSQEAALEKFMAQQLDPKSANYHHWLQPDEFGALYGPSESDIAAVTSWLSNHGFVVGQVTRGRTLVEFSGTAAQVQQAFHTQIHRFEVNGESHFANVSDPYIPAALSPVVFGVQALHDFKAKPLHVYGGSFKRDSKTSKWHPDQPAPGASPLYTIGSGSGTYELVTPWDFAAIYDFKSAWLAGTDGTGQTIAIAGRSDIDLADIAAFRSSYNLPPSVPNVIVTGTDPGMADAGSHLEAELDVEWSGAAAKGASVTYVVSTSETTAASYIVNNNIAPVMSFSFGLCESALGTAGNAAYNTLWQQGAAEGMSIFVASGDSGSAGCDTYFPATPYLTSSGLQVNGLASTPYNVSVGGTDFDWINSTTSYWNATNDVNGASALGYVPEVPWNGGCASDAIDILIGGTPANGYPNEESVCNYIYVTDPALDYLVTDIGGGGGVSSVYAKPSWQTALTPADGQRDVPDVSLFASNGELNSYWVVCDSADGTACSSTSTDGVGGTSVASPVWAGIMAIITQKMGGVRQGNVNSDLYRLFALEQPTCTQGVTCSFHDITSGNISSPCSIGSPNCTVVNPGDSLGLLTGFTAGPGFDLASGLGSADGANMLANWSSVGTLGAPPTGYIDAARDAKTGSTTTVGAADNLVINGWAADQVQGSPVSQVQVLIDGKAAGAATLGFSRPDVATAFNNPAWIHAGWSFTFAAKTLALGSHTINATATDAQSQTTNLPGMKTITVAAAPPLGYTDAAVDATTKSTSVVHGHNLLVSGWAADLQQGAPVSKVQVLIDGTVVGNATLGIARADVAAAYKNPAWTNSGWTFTGLTTTLTIGNHTVTAVATDALNLTATLVGMKTISITNAPPTGVLGLAVDATTRLTTVTKGDNISVGGWAADLEDGAPVKQVQVFIDGSAVGLATLGIARPDVAAAYSRPAWLNSGWSFTYSSSTLATGTHTITAIATDLASATTTLSTAKTITVQ